LFASGATPWHLLIPYLLAVHTLIGIPLAVAWRRSGSLALPAAAHAIIDGIRNTLLAT
jgi:membrane protease YdiL (CAAX protease family)